MLSLKEYILLETLNGKCSIKIQNYGESQKYYKYLLYLLKYEGILEINGLKFYAKRVTYCEDASHMYITLLDTVMVIYL